MRAPDAAAVVEPYVPRRRLLLALSGLGAAALAACSDQPSDVAAVQPQQRQQVADALHDLSSAVDDLQTAIGRFDDDNWRDVVPDVRSAAGDINDALSSLQSQLSQDE
jgi:uncharacterized protein YukE